MGTTHVDKFKECWFFKSKFCFGLISLVAIGNVTWCHLCLYIQVVYRKMGDHRLMSPGDLNLITYELDRLINHIYALDNGLKECYGFIIQIKIWDKRFLQLLILYDEHYEYEPKFCVRFRVDKIEAAKQAFLVLVIFYCLV